MKGEELIEALKNKLEITSDKDLGVKLGVSVHNWRNRELTLRIVTSTISHLARQRLTGEAIIREAKKKLNTASFKELAGQLGVSKQAIQIWKGRDAVTSRQIAGLIASTKAAIEREAHATSIRPLVEFFPITKTPSKQKAKFEIFSNKQKYQQGLKIELQSHHGVYIFFDSRGQAIYSGKARKQRLWNELNLAFNRKRDSLQKIRKVRHPSREQQYKTSDEKSRQINEYSVPLCELAHYVSAYHVVDGMINVVESLLVRSFANDLLNKRMEKFGRRAKV